MDDHDRRACGRHPVQLATERNAIEPAWSPDGRTISFLSNTEGSPTGNVWSQPADGSGMARLMLASKRPLSEEVWLPSGTGLVVRTTTSTAGSGDLLATSSLSDTIATPIVATKRAEYSPAVSPDGQWLAYSSDLTGRFEVYIVPRTAPASTRVLVSTAGGSSPRWSADGRALFYLTLETRLMEARISTAPTLRVDGMRTLFNASQFVQTSTSRRNYDVAPDGRFLFVRRSGDAQPSAMVVVEHFVDEVRGAVKR